MPQAKPITFFFFLQTVVGKLKQSSQFLFGDWTQDVVLGNWRHHAYSHIGRGMPPTGVGREDRKRGRQKGGEVQRQPTKQRKTRGAGVVVAERADQENFKTPRLSSLSCLRWGTFFNLGSKKIFFKNLPFCLSYFAFIFCHWPLKGSKAYGERH